MSRGHGINTRNVLHRETIIRLKAALGARKTYRSVSTTGNILETVKKNTFCSDYCGCWWDVPTVVTFKFPSSGTTFIGCCVGSETA